LSQPGLERTLSDLVKQAYCLTALAIGSPSAALDVARLLEAGRQWLW
jgi:hypothetical protein